MIKSGMVKKSDAVLKIGLDLDGVILYNPARIVRPIIAFIKRFFLHKKKLKFYVPKSKFKQFIWHIFHKSSIFVAPGFEEIKQMAKEGKIEVYIITARYSFLKNDFEDWVKKIHAADHFKGCYYNKNDEQPHLFKERMIKELNLDVFVEDNWDIVNYLTSQKLKAKIFWVYNIFDKNIHYPYKFAGLEKTIPWIKKNIA